MAARLREVGKVFPLRDPAGASVRPSPSIPSCAAPRALHLLDRLRSGVPVAGLARTPGAATLPAPLPLDGSSG
jgi:hypothetical protein